jgi:hypothetical protein
MADFIPQPEGKLVLMLTNLDSKIDGYAIALGIDPVLLAEIHVKIKAIIKAINDAIAGKQTWKNLEAAKRGTKTEILGFLRTNIARFKTESGYTEAIGKDLGIIGTTDTFDHNAYKPTLKATVFPKYINLEFIKKGIDAVNIYVRIKGGTEWTFLARDTRSPYHDSENLKTAGVPEVREYMCIGVIADEEIGQESDVVTVVFDGLK